MGASGEPVQPGSADYRGSRGLGLALAREFARVGCRLVLTARDAQELARARQDLT